ncbi:MAG TPA: type II toxin-antitoxin system PemK/MazF family toxin [Candidatus Paceibacterota bacterium]|nr:type II toxin-antitoxin system PemK/MazF family toxin [Candidatus Paceibacterota bacterium]
MDKDFDKWNNRKKIIHNNGETKLYHEREVWWCSLGLNIGFEQDGTGTEGERPVLILRGFSKDVCLIVPLTTSVKKNPYHVSLGKIDGREAFAIISQIRLIDTKRLVNKIGFIDQEIFEIIRKTVKGLL